MHKLTSYLLAVWFAAVLVLGARGAFVRPADAAPLPILFGAAGPLVAFFAAYVGSTTFRKYLLAVDLTLLTGIQAWRAGGLVFLALYAQDLLPGLFAWPAALGDIAIGATAPWVAQRARRPSFARGPLFLAWNMFGILDLLVAVTTGVLSSGLVPGLAGSVTTAPMSQLPLVLIPAYLVPLFIMLHVVALRQARRTQGDERGIPWDSKLPPRESTPQVAGV